jgi:Na+/H+ antiporter NhaD/arsenite permease-like protein
MNPRLGATLGLAALIGIFVKVHLGGPAVAGVRGEFFLFGLTLAGVALFHYHTLQVSVLGLAAVLLFKFVFVPDFQLVEHLHHEWSILLNLLGLLLGFAVLAKHFEDSGVPEILPRFLPDDWRGGFALLAVVFVLSSFLDNIAAAMIGGAIALVVFKGRVHIGYLAAITAASNAGGAGSVLGDTTTTMMWIDGVAAVDVVHAYVAAIPCLFLFGIAASLKQQRFQPIQKDEMGHHQVDWARLAVVGLILAGTVATNVLLDFPAAGVWAAILAGSLFTRTPWREVPAALKGSLFLVCLVLCASLMPVDQLPAPSWQSAFALGFVSSVFDNIPLTKLALDQGGYDWGVLAFAVGFGGSMVWFGSSAGVALSNIFPQAKSVGGWLRHGWPVVVAYALSFFIMLGLWGWHPHPPHQGQAPAAQTLD